MIRAVGADRKMSHGDVDKNLDGLSFDPKVPAVIGGAAEAE
jgi:hypothetical protein